jgi:hypothetical protein
MCYVPAMNAPHSGTVVNGTSYLRMEQQFSAPITNALLYRTRLVIRHQFQLQGRCQYQFLVYSQVTSEISAKYTAGWEGV